MADIRPRLDRIARLLDRQADPAELNEALDELEFLYDAVTNDELQEVVTDLIGQLRKRIQDTG